MGHPGILQQMKSKRNRESDITLLVAESCRLDGAGDERYDSSFAMSLSGKMLKKIFSPMGSWARCNCTYHEIPQLRLQLEPKFLPEGLKALGADPMQ